MDLILRNGRVIDGTGAPGRQADVLVRGGHIAEIGVGTVADVLEIECAGMVVAPGFIDAHSHGDQEVLQHLPYKIQQGVTTEIVGNCGFSLFPTRPNPAGELITGELFDGEPREGMATAADYYAAVKQAGTYVNVAALTGHGPLRIWGMQMRGGPPQPAEQQEMERALDACLETGSIGLSTGLNCMPSSFANTEELVGYGRVLRRHNRFYTTHMRDYKFRVVEAVDEALAVGRRARIPVQLSHLQVVGQKNWHKLETVLEHIEEARREGVDVAMDAYPYLAGSCSLTQLLPAWCQDGGVPALRARLESPADSDRISRETEDGMSNTWDDIVVCKIATGADATLVGRSIAHIAAERNQAPAATALHLIREAGVWIISFNNHEANLRKVLAHPLTSIITDGLVVEGISHPRTFGTYPKLLGEFVREKGWFTLEEAVHKSSGLPASRFHLRGRGTLAPAYAADIVVFDPATIGCDGDYEHPARAPRGIAQVLVNGRFAIRDGVLTGERAGEGITHV
jgi:N-acyl-D-amino-acid deacylase